MLWTAGVNTGRLTKEEFVAVTSANSARILNIYPRKGAVAVGSDADLVIWDPEATKTIAAKKQISRIDYNVFEGFRCTGLPRATLSRGEIAWLDGELRARSRRRPIRRRAPAVPVARAMSPTPAVEGRVTSSLPARRQSSAHARSRCTAVTSMDARSSCA